VAEQRGYFRESVKKVAPNFILDSGAKVAHLPNFSDENLRVACTARNILLKSKKNFLSPTISPYIWACQRAFSSTLSSPTLSSAYRL
jgi:hypothetical protein